MPEGQKSLGRSPLQELEVGPLSRPYLLVHLNGKQIKSKEIKKKALILNFLKLITNLMRSSKRLPEHKRLSFRASLFGLFSINRSLLPLKIPQTPVAIVSLLSVVPSPYQSEDTTGIRELGHALLS